MREIKMLTSLQVKYMAWATRYWGFNCGPGALCALTGMDPDDLRPILREVDFEDKHYMSPQMMGTVVGRLGLDIDKIFEGEHGSAKVIYPDFGLVRVQWGGPWMRDDDFIKRYQQTHWIAVDNRGHSGLVFDINAINIGGWITWLEWQNLLVPWLLDLAVPGADGGWWATHCWEVDIDKWTTKLEFTL